MNSTMKRFISVFLAMTMAVVMTACGGSSGKKAEEIGTYTVYEIISDGEKVEHEALVLFGLDELFTLELKEGGTGSIALDGEDEEIKWGNGKITADGESYPYKYSDGKLTLTMDGDEIVFAKKEGEPAKSSASETSKTDGEKKSNTTITGGKKHSDSSESSEKSKTPVIEAGTYEDDFWSGDWYGTWYITSSWGSWEGMDGIQFDCLAKITRRKDDTGTIVIWDEIFSDEVNLAECEITFGPGTTEDGAFMSESGTFIDADLNHADWIVDPGASAVSDYYHAICIDGTYDDPEDEGGLDYWIVLRPWGMEWEDIRDAGENYLPEYYEDWYLPKIKNGESMPDYIEVE